MGTTPANDRMSSSGYILASVVNRSAPLGLGNDHSIRVIVVKVTET